VDHVRIASDVPPAKVQAALVRIRRWLGTLPPRVAIVVRDCRFRPVLRRLIKAEFPNVPVLADKELTGDHLPASAVVTPAEASHGPGN
jgi:flagellar biosynthesis component FlhA